LRHRWSASNASSTDGHPLLDALGPEPFDAAFDAHYLWRTTRARRAAIKLVLMDNHVVTGVGNIYANEALFRAGIRPTARANRLSKARLARLVDAVRDVLGAAIAKGGSTLRDYVGSDGAAGYFQLDYFVYGRAGLPCRVCGTPIRQVRVGQRSAFYCPHCQRG
jgi:formamidopyrimidine-DNA glycosylase